MPKLDGTEDTLDVEGRYAMTGVEKVVGWYAKHYEADNWITTGYNGPYEDYEKVPSGLEYYDGTFVLRKPESIKP